MKRIRQLIHSDTGKQIDTFTVERVLMEKMAVLLQVVRVVAAVVVTGVFVSHAQAQTKKPRAIQKTASSAGVKSKSKHNKRGYLVAQNGTGGAQAPVAQSTSTISQEKPAEKNWSVALGVDYNVSTVKEEVTGQSTSIDYTLNPAYKFSKDLSISALTVLSQERTGEKQTLLSDTTVPLSYKGYYFSEDSFTRHSIAAILPTSKKSKEETRLQGGVRVTNGVTLCQCPYVEATYGFGIQRNFHEYTLNNEGSPNIQWQQRHRLDLSFNLTESLSIKTWGLYTIGYTYANFTRYGFATDVSAEYAITNGLSVSAGFSNEGPALKANGLDSNIAVYDDKTSTYHAGVGYSF